MNVAFTRCFGRLRFSNIALLILLAASFLGGCVRSVDPILKSEQFISNDKIVGHWVAKNGKEKVEIGAANENKEFKVRYTDDQGKIGRFSCHLGEIKQFLILEYFPEEPGDTYPELNKSMVLPLCSFIVIKQTEPEVIIAAMSSDWFKKYMTEHPGELSLLGGSPDKLIITATTDDIQKFILAHITEEGFLIDPQTYVRAESVNNKKT